MPDLVSVVVPTYNRAYCVCKTIDSALAQTHGNLEVLVSDDGSTDNTRELIRQEYGHDARVKYLYHPNQGVSGARNVGLEKAQGDYIALLDSDDLWRPWKLEVQLRCLQAVPEAGMVWTDMEALDPAGNVVYPRYLRLMYHAYRWFSNETLYSSKRSLQSIFADPPDGCADAVLYSGDIFSPMIMGNLVHTSTVLLTRERFNKVRTFDVDLRVSGEDYDFHLRTCREGPVAYLDVPSIQYQLGYQDRLSQHLDAVAKNFLTTLEKTIARERAHIRLPSWMVQRVLAESNSWVGDELLSAGDKSAAAIFYRRSLGHKKWQPRIVLQWLRCHLPAPLERTMLTLYRLGKRPNVATADRRP